MDNVIQNRGFEKVVMREKGSVAQSCMDPEGGALGKDRECREVATSSKAAIALQLEFPAWEGLLGSCGVMKPLAVGLEKSPSLEEDSQRDRLEQGPGSLGTARCCFFGMRAATHPRSLQEGRAQL